MSNRRTFPRDRSSGSKGDKLLSITRTSRARVPTFIGNPINRIGCP
ncbi:MAG TPA: hypothetical protein V6D03_09305 [Candidatus Caenarcaniphilales bacterium]